MKKIILLLLCTLSLTSYAQLTVNRKIAQRWDQYNSSAWQGQDSTIFLYNAFGDETFRFGIKGLNNNTWDNNFRTSTTYDANQNISTTTRESWQNSTWKYINKYIYSYNASNSRTETLYQTWNTNTNAWKNTGQIIYTLNANQKPTKLETFTWDGSAWQPGTRQIMVYNALNELITHEFYFYSNGVFEKQERKQYQYAFGYTSSYINSTPDNGGNWVLRVRELNLINGSATPPHLVTNRIQPRNNISGLWVDSLRTTYTYTGNLLMQSEKERYNAGSSQWTPQNLNTFNYNANNLLAEESNFTYQTSTSNYQNVLKQNLTYNSNNLNDEIIYSESDGNNGWAIKSRDAMNYNSNDSLIYRLNENYTNASYVPNEQYFYHYAEVPVGLSRYNNLFTNAKLFPNPCKNTVRIETNQKIQGAYRATVYSIEGKKVWNQLNPGLKDELRFTFNDLPEGTYILQITELQSSKTQHFKFTKR